MVPAPLTRPTIRRWLDAAGRAAVSAGLTSVLCLVALSTAPLAWGWQSFTVVSGSMEPGVHRGDVVVAEPYDGGRLALGDVVVVAPPEDGRDAGQQPMTHRVVEVLPDGRVRTRGDANPVADSRLVARADVMAKGRLLVPEIGRVGLLPAGVRAAGLLVLLALLMLRLARARRTARLVGAATALLLVGPALGIAAEAPSSRTAAVATGATLAHTSYLSTSSYYANAVQGTASASLRGYWRLDETSGTYADTSGVASPTSLTPSSVPSGASLTRGVLGGLAWDTDRAVTFTRAGSGSPASGAYLISPSNVAGLAIPGPVTAAAWVRTPAGSPQAPTARVLVKGDNTHVNYLLAFDGGGTFMRFLNDNAGLVRVSVSKAWPTDGAWHFVVGTYDGSANRLYLDGVLVASTAQSGALDAPVNPLVVGANPAVSGNNPINGTIDEVSVWATALTPAQVLSLYKAGTKS